MSRTKKENRRNRRNRQDLIKKLKYFTVLCVLTLACAGCKKETKEAEDTLPEPTPTETVTETPTPTPEEAIISAELMEEEEIPEGMVISHLTGEYVAEEIGTRRPVAVMINNIKAALPSSGLSKAGVIYEAPVEGSLTRLMPIFEDYDALDKIGSVRSCRDYFINYAMGFEAIYVHYGQAAYALPYLESDAVNNLSGLSGYGEKVFYRTSDRKAPHNAYTSAEGIQKGIDILGYSQSYSEDYESPLNFVQIGEEVTLENGSPATTVKPGYTVNTPWFEYNAEDGLYYRYEYGEAQIDETFDTQLAVKNIIFQYSSWRNYDENGYPNIDAAAGGACKYFTNGKVIAGTWTRDGQWGGETYYDSEGNEININTGKTWICVIQDTYADRVEIS